MKINGVELEFDVSNPEDLTAASHFIDETRGVIAGCQGGKFLEQIPSIHRAVSGCFDRMYGPGVGSMVCGEKSSGMTAVTAVCEFMEEYFRQLEQMEQLFGRTAKLWDRIDQQSKKVAKEAAGSVGNIRDSEGTGRPVAVPIPMRALSTYESPDSV